MLYEEELTKKIIGAAMEVHRELGPGLLESAYQIAMARELAILEIPFESEKSIPLEYKGTNLDCGYRLDFLADGKVIIELKSVDQVEQIHKAQLLTYLRLTGLKVGLLINFNVSVLRNGINRMVL